jgi:hypothetical protein
MLLRSILIAAALVTHAAGSSLEIIIEPVF